MIGRALLAMAVACSLATPAHAGTADPRAIELVDQRGDAFRLADLAGAATIVTFVATRCDQSCPIADGQFAQLAGILDRDRIRATLVTVTLDPAYDTPFVMANFSRAFGDHANWRFASGRADRVRALMRAFGVAAENGGRREPQEHSTFVYVLDRHARLARTLLLSDHLVADAEAQARAIDAR